MTLARKRMNRMRIRPRHLPAAALAALVLAAPAGGARAYDIDCAALLCLSGGLTTGPVCAPAWAYVLRRIAPPRPKPPFGPCETEDGTLGAEARLWSRTERVCAQHRWFYGGEGGARRVCALEKATHQRMIAVVLPDEPPRDVPLGRPSVTWTDCLLDRCGGPCDGCGGQARGSER